MKNKELSDIEARAADWVAERDRGDGVLGPGRQAELDDWLCASTAHRVAFLRLDQAWQRADRLRALQPAAPAIKTPAPAPAPGWTSRAANLAWLPRRPAHRVLAGMSLAAAVAVLAIGFGRGPATLDYATERGGRELVTLADGSQLTLNTATQVRTAVTPQGRQVWLERGEAFFDIAHDAKRPFVIHAGKQTVTVLGTKFSLFRDGEQLRVEVLEGRVQVQADQGQPTVLTHADAALADAGGVLVTKQSQQQLSASLGWLQGKLVFDEVSLGEAARQFNRYGSKQLVIKDETAAHIRIGGVFDAANVEAFARLVHAGFGLDVQVKGEEIEVSSPAS